MSDFTNLLSRFTSSLDDQTRTLEEATANDNFGNQRPWEQQKQQTSNSNQASAAHLLEPTTNGLFRELGSLNQALDECYNFVGISDTSSAGGGTPLAKLVARAHEIASSNERVLSKAQELASSLGPLRSRNNSFEASPNGSAAPCTDAQNSAKCYTPLRSGRFCNENDEINERSAAKQNDLRTPLGQLGHMNKRSKSTRRKSGVLLRRSDPPTPSFEDMGLSAKSMAIIDKENSTGSMATPGPTAAATGGAGHSSVYRTGASAATSRRAQDKDTRSHALASSQARLWLTPARGRLPESRIDDDNNISPRSEHNTPPLPQRKYSHEYVGQELPDLLGADDDESDSHDEDEEETTAANVARESEELNDVNYKLAIDSSKAEDAPQSPPTSQSASYALHDEADVVVSMQDCEKLPFYLRNQMSVDDINTLLLQLGDRSAGTEFSGVEFNEVAGLDSAKSRVALLVLIKLKRLQVVTTGVYRLVFA